MTLQEYDARYKTLMAELKPLLEMTLGELAKNPKAWGRSKKLQRDVLDLIHEWTTQ